MELVPRWLRCAVCHSCVSCLHEALYEVVPQAPAKSRMLSKPTLLVPHAVHLVFCFASRRLRISPKGTSVARLPDLTYLTENKFLCIFTCANDYADLNGESLVRLCSLVCSAGGAAPTSGEATSSVHTRCQDLDASDTTIPGPLILRNFGRLVLG